MAGAGQPCAAACTADVAMGISCRSGDNAARSRIPLPRTGASDPMPDLYFAIPGALATLTGGYAYDRRLLAGLAELGLTVELLPLSGTFPHPDAVALADAEARFAALPDGASVLVDGLAYGALDALALRHSRRLRLLALCHHPLALETGLASSTAQYLQQAEQRALAEAAAVIVSSAATARQLVQDYGVPAHKLTVALPGTDRHGFAACRGTVPVLLTVATLTRRKAHDVLITALAGLAQLPWVARFVGGDAFDPQWALQLRQQVAALGLQQRISFVGELEDLREEYAGADLFVLPSLHEGYGMVFAEALAAGLPIVATSAGAIPEVVPASAGVLVPPADAAALQAALGSLLAVGDGALLRAELQRGARAAAEQLPDWTATAALVADLVDAERI